MNEIPVNIQGKLKKLQSGIYNRHTVTLPGTEYERNYYISSTEEQAIWQFKNKWRIGLKKDLLTDTCLVFTKLTHERPYDSENVICWTLYSNQSYIPGEKSGRTKFDLHPEALKIEPQFDELDFDSSSQEKTHPIWKIILIALFYVENFKWNTIFLTKFFVPVITFIEIVISLNAYINLTNSENITWDGPVIECSELIYDPFRRYQGWRYFSYIFVHIGWLHFVFNIILQIIVGVPCELSLKSWIGSIWIFFLYMAGVIAGSIGTSFANPDTYLAGMYISPFQNPFLLS